MCLSDLSGYSASSVIYHLWWRELGRLPDWANECKCTVQLAGVSSFTPPSLYLFSSLSIRSKPINKCGMSFTMAVKRLIFIKKERNGHLFGTWGTCMCFDSDDKHTWQLNYVLSPRFLFYLGDGNPLREQPLWLNTWKVAFMVPPALLLFHLAPRCVAWYSGARPHVKRTFLINRRHMRILHSGLPHA